MIAVAVAGTLGDSAGDQNSLRRYPAKLPVSLAFITPNLLPHGTLQSENVTKRYGIIKSKFKKETTAHNLAPDRFDLMKQVILFVTEENFVKSFI